MDKDSSKPAASSASTTPCSPPRTRSRGSDDGVGATKVTGRRSRNGGRENNNNALAQSSTVDDFVASPSSSPSPSKKKSKHEHDDNNATDISNAASSTIAAANTPTCRPPLQPLRTSATTSPLRNLRSPLAATSAASPHIAATGAVGGGSFKSEEHDVSNPAPTTGQTFSIIGVGDGRNSKQITNVMHLLRGLSAKVPLAPVAYNPIVAKENETFYPFDKARKKRSWKVIEMMAQVTKGKKHELTFNGKDSFERRWNRLRMEMKLKGILLSSLGEFNSRFSLVCAQPKDQRIATTHTQTITSGCFLHCEECGSLTRALACCSGKFAFTADERAINNFSGCMNAKLLRDHSERTCELYKKTCPCNKTFLGLLAEGQSIRFVTNHMKLCTGGVPDADTLFIELQCFHDEFGMQTKPIMPRSSRGEIGRGRGWNITRETRLCNHLTRARSGEIPTTDEQKQQFMNLGEELKPKSGGSAVAGLQFRYGEIAIYAGAGIVSEKAFKTLKRFKSGAHAKNFRAKKDTNEEWAGLTIHSATTNLNGWITTKEAIQAKEAWLGSNAYKTA